MVEETRVEYDGYYEKLPSTPEQEQLPSASDLRAEIETLAKASNHPYVIPPEKHIEIQQERKKAYVEQEANAVTLTPEQIKFSRLRLALICIGDCITDIGNAMLQAQPDESKLGGIACGLERAACYVRGVPYNPNPKTED